MDFKKCEALLAAIDTGSFTKAAEQLHYTCHFFLLHTLPPSFL